MSTDTLNDLQGHAQPDMPTRGHPARIWAADVVTVNADGTVDIQPVQSRATKVGVLCPAGYTPTVGDRILVTDLNGDPRTPIVLVAVTAAFSAISQQLFSSGDLKLSAVPSAPTGWLLCDGSPVSRVTYAALYAALGGAGSPWGQGNGSTTFNVPDLRGRVPLGAGTGTATGGTAHTLGQQPTSGAGGEETHLLTGPESGIQAHNHPWSDSGFGLGVDNEITGGGAVGHYVRGSGVQGAGTTGPTNATSAHNIMQPSATVNYFIKT